MSGVAAVIFDLDGVLIDTEQVWDEARRQLTRELGGQWRDEATHAMMGMSSPEWSGYMHSQLGVPRPPVEISRLVVDRLAAMYRQRLPLMPGAGEAVARMAARWPVGMASSANRELIDLVIDLAGWRSYFRATVSSEEVGRGKPAPDVYLAAADRLSLPAAACVAVEDSGTGIRAGKAAGMTVAAIPNRALPPSPADVARADLVLDTLAGLTVEAIERLRA